MTVRVVEWKKPYTWGTAIEITPDKVINLRLRDENNLIIYDEWDDEIYVDLQLPDELRPTDAFPVGVTTGRVIVDNGWDVTGTIVCFKTTSGDNIKLLYADDGKLYIDNGTGTFKQIYLKGEVDALLLELRNYVDAQLALKQDTLVQWQNIIIWADGVTINAIDTTYTAWENITIDANNNNEIWCSFLVSWATAPATPTQWLLWNDTTSWLLKVYVWSWWVVVWDMLYSKYEFASVSSASSITISNINTSLTPLEDFTLACGDVIEGLQYILRIESASTAYTMTLGTGVTNPYGETLTLTANETTLVTMLATSSSTLEITSVKTSS